MCVLLCDVCLLSTVFFLLFFLYLSVCLDSNNIMRVFRTKVWIISLQYRLVCVTFSDGMSDKFVRDFKAAFVVITQDEAEGPTQLPDVTINKKAKDGEANLDKHLRMMFDQVTAEVGNLDQSYKRRKTFFCNQPDPAMWLAELGSLHPAVFDVKLGKFQQKKTDGESDFRFRKEEKGDQHTKEEHKMTTYYIGKASQEKEDGAITPGSFEGKSRLPLRHLTVVQNRTSEMINRNSLSSSFCGV
jgi:hypothetical protein